LIEETKIIDSQEIQKILPHRYPFLMVDKVLDFQPLERLVAQKNVTVNEPQFTGHFPGAPIFPGVFILEALAQSAGILAYKSGKGATENELYYFAGIDNARFRKPVMPGDTLILTIEFHKMKKGIIFFKGIAQVDRTIVCEANLMCAKREI